MQRAHAQVELRNVIAELADVARKREAGLVVAEVDLAPLRLHADELERELACAHRDSLLNSLLVYVWFNTHAPSNLLQLRSSFCRFVRLPMDAGMAPARGLVSFCVCLIQQTHG